MIGVERLNRSWIAAFRALVPDLRRADIIFGTNSAAAMAFRM